MMIYNVTVKVSPEVVDEWLKWMREVHIPDVMATGMFLSWMLSDIQVKEPDGKTFAVQYLCESADKYETYQSEFAPRLQEAHSKRYKDQFVAFRTMMHVIDQGNLS